MSIYGPSTEYLASLSEEEQVERRILWALKDPTLLSLLQHAEDWEARLIRRKSGYEDVGWHDAPKAVRDGLETLHLVEAITLEPAAHPDRWRTVRTGVGQRIAFDTYRRYRIAYTAPGSRGGHYVVWGRTESDAVERLRTQYLARLTKREQRRITLSDPTLVA